MPTDALRVCVVVSKWLDEVRPQNWNIFRAVAIKCPMDDATQEVSAEDRTDGGCSDYPHCSGLSQLGNNRSQKPCAGHHPTDEPKPLVLQV